MKKTFIHDALKLNVTQYLTIYECKNVSLVCNELHIPWQTLIQQRLEKEMINVVIPDLLKESMFSSYIWWKLRERQLIKVENIDHKKFFGASFSQNNNFKKNIDKKVQTYIQNLVVPRYFMLSQPRNDDMFFLPEVQQFFTHYGFTVKVNKIELDQSEQSNCIMQWNIENNNKKYTIFEIPHINKILFEKFKNNSTFEKGAFYILLFKLPIWSSELEDADIKEKKAQITFLVNEIKEKKGKCIQICMSGGVTEKIYNELSDDVLSNIQTMYADYKSLENLKNTIVAAKYTPPSRQKLLISILRDCETEESMYGNILSDEKYSLNPYTSCMDLRQLFKESPEQSIIRYNKNLDLLIRKSYHSPFFAHKPMLWIHTRCSPNREFYNYYTMEKACGDNIIQYGDYDLYKIAHDYLMCSYIPATFYVDISYFYSSAGNIAKEYLKRLSSKKLKKNLNEAMKKDDPGASGVLIQILFDRFKNKEEKLKKIIEQYIKKHIKYPSMPLSTQFKDIAEIEENMELINQIIKKKIKLLYHTKTPPGLHKVLREDVEYLFSLLSSSKKSCIPFVDQEIIDILDNFLIKYSKINIFTETTEDRVKEILELTSIFKILLGYLEKPIVRSLYIVYFLRDIFLYIRPQQPNWDKAYVPECIVDIKNEVWPKIDDLIKFCKKTDENLSNALLADFLLYDGMIYNFMTLHDTIYDVAPFFDEGVRKLEKEYKHKLEFQDEFVCENVIDFEREYYVAPLKKHWESIELKRIISAKAHEERIKLALSEQVSIQKKEIATKIEQLKKRQLVHEKLEQIVEKSEVFKNNSQRKSHSYNQRILKRMLKRMLKINTKIDRTVLENGGNVINQKKFNLKTAEIVAFLTSFGWFFYQYLKWYTLKPVLQN